MFNIIYDEIADGSFVIRENDVTYQLIIRDNHEQAASRYGRKIRCNEQVEICIQKKDTQPIIKYAKNLAELLAILSGDKKKHKDLEISE